MNVSPTKFARTPTKSIVVFCHSAKVFVKIQTIKNVTKTKSVVGAVLVKRGLLGMKTGIVSWTIFVLVI